MEINELAQKFNTDKNISGGYLDNYSKYFNEKRNYDIKLLELGIFKGGSLKLWKEYFQEGVIVGLDRKLPVDLNEDRIVTYEGSQDDKVLLSKIGNEVAKDGFDIIIDDCSHIGSVTKNTFWYMFDNYLKIDGIYVIEDWGTGYWDSWVDGRRYNVKRFKATWWEIISDTISKNRLTKRIKSHDFGLVGFVKELIDEMGMGDITNQNFGVPPPRNPKFKSMEFFHGQLFIVKA